MKKLVLTQFLVLLFSISFAQNTDNDNKLSSLLKADVSLQGIGMTYDAKAGKNLSIELSGGIGGGYGVSEASLDYQFALLQPAFYFYASPKFFYNRKKRFQKGRNNKYNAGNYFGARLKYTTADISSSGWIREALLLNGHWGMQRAIGKHWSFYANGGAGYAWDVYSKFGTIYPALDLKFSYVIFKKK